VLLAPRMPRTFRPSKSPTRTRESVENVERPLAPAEAPPSRDAAMGPTPRVALESPKEKALASRRHQEVMARSKSPPRQLRPQAMPKIAAPVSCAEAGYHSRPNRTPFCRGSCLSAVHHPRLWAARHALEGRWGIQARTSRASAEQPQLIAHFFPPRGAEGSSHALAEPPPPAAAARLQLPLQLVRVGARLSLLTCLVVCLLAYALPAILPALLPAGGIAPEPEPVPAPPLTLENSTGSLGDNAEWSPPQK